MNFGTLLIHNGHEADSVTGALGVTVYQTSTFDQSGVFQRPGEVVRPGV